MHDWILKHGVNALKRPFPNIYRCRHTLDMLPKISKTLILFSDVAKYVESLC